MRSITVEKGGLLSTVQDRGRFGYQRYGIPSSGAMDFFALESGNILVGNPRDSAAIEIISGDFVVRFNDEFRIAVTGAQAEVSLNGEKIEEWHTLRVESGDCLEIGKVKKGYVTYLCISGGVDVPVVFGSRSTYVRMKLGGYLGRKLKKGDELEIGKPSSFTYLMVDDSILKLIYSPRKIRVLLGPERNRFSREALQRFLSSVYRITSESDRMGYRLEGPPIHAKRGHHGIISNGIATGAIQVPASGKPIMMMVDHQTIGGYAKISTVISADLPLLAQMKAGDEIEFEDVSLQEAHTAYRDLQLSLQKLEERAHRVKSYIVVSGGKMYKVNVRRMS